MQQKWNFRLMAQDQSTISPAEMLDSQLFNEPLSRALEKLNVVERNLLILRVFEEKSFAEIAGILNKSPDARDKKTNYVTYHRIVWRDDHNHLLYEISNNTDSALGKEDLVKIAEEMITSR